ncbi:MAG TPA: DUF3617 domain-containing protein [Allosphingosinicella sp.]|jgi:hypothetical protein
MRGFLLCLASSAALAACGGSGDKSQGNAAGGSAAGGTASAASAGAGQVNLRPGEWETVIETGAPEGMPEEVARMMKGNKITSRSCLTQKDVDERQGGLFTGDKDNSCKQRNVTVSGGRVQGTMICGDADDKVETSIDGQFGPDSYQMKSRTKTGDMTVTATITSRRVGDCPGGSSG